MSHNIGARQVAAAAEAIERHARETLVRLLDATMASVSERLMAGVKRASLHAIWGNNGDEQRRNDPKNP